MVGLGTGDTAGWLAAVPSIERVDAVELEPAILKVAEICAPVNRHALENPKLHVIIGDGRELLLTLRAKYDWSVSEPSNPYRAGVANLFTREFYQSIKNRLNPGGIFLQWVQTYSVDDRTIEIFYRTLGSVFPNIESWQTEEGDLLLAASQEPIRYDVDTLRERLASDPFKEAILAAWEATKSLRFSRALYRQPESGQNAAEYRRMAFKHRRPHGDRVRVCPKCRRSKRISDCYSSQ